MLDHSFDAYPKRPPFFAMKVIRCLQKTGAANHIGRDAAWLITTIASLEDTKRYSGPVAFWNEHLMDVTGFSSKGTFVKARARAIESRWLIHIEGRKGIAAVYWTDIPGSAKQFLGSDVLEITGPDSDQQTICRPVTGPNPDRQPDGKRTGNRTESGPHSYLCPSPIPEEGATLPKVSSKSSPEDEATARWMFDIVLQLQPEHKLPNFEEWAKDIRLMRERDGRTDADIRALFSAADADEFWQTNIRCPVKLRKQWDKLELKFRKSKASGKEKSTDFEAVRANVNRSWSPDLKNHRDVETAVGNADLYQAAKLTGLSIIADCRDEDREVQSAFAGHLDSIRSGRRAIA